MKTYTISGPRGLEATISNYGAKLLNLFVPNAQGERVDILLGFDNPDDWQTKEQYFNAVVGRFANRIKDGRFTLDGETYQLPINNGTNSLHGGINGFHLQTWSVVGQSAHSITFRYRSADGEEGYPGQLDVEVDYRFNREGALVITYQATTTRPTIINLTNHAYFNLEGEGAPSVRQHTLQVLADQYTPFDPTACPTGEILPVGGTAMDFRQPTLIADRIDDPFFAPGRGIDNNFVLSKRETNGSLAKAAVLSAAGRTMEVWTTCPGMQVYTGNYVEENIGKQGHRYQPQNAICLETQNFPDAPNHDNFPSPILRPGQLYRSQTAFKFMF